MSVLAEKTHPEWAAAVRATEYLVALSKNLPRQLYPCEFTRWIWLFGKPAILVPEPSKSTLSIDRASFIDAAYLMAQADGLAIRITLPQTICIKFLDCVRNSKPNLETRNLLNLFAGNYIEFTSDRTGVQLFCKGIFPNIFSDEKCLISLVRPDSDRYICLTGDVYQKSIDRHLWYAQGAINELLKRIRSEKTSIKLGASPMSQSTVSDPCVILKALKSKNKTKFKRLWNGDHSGYTSVVEADLALIGILKYWTDGDRVQTDRLYRMSGMYRDSWDNRMVKDISYGQATLNYVFST
ncbi:MAG: hypothetical protein V3V31_11480 [Methylococcales bacterium]